jgi:hypothetical protein
MHKLAGSLQEAQKSSIALGKVLPTYLREITPGAAAGETRAGPKGIVPSLLIGNRPLSAWK